MESLSSYLVFGALVVVVILLVWALILINQERHRKVTARSRLANLRKKVEEMPEATEEDREKKELLHRELYLEYFDNILGEIEKIQIQLSKKTQDAKKSKKESKKK